MREGGTKGRRGSRETSGTERRWCRVSVGAPNLRPSRGNLASGPVLRPADPRKGPTSERRRRGGRLLGTELYPRDSTVPQPRGPSRAQRDPSPERPREDPPGRRSAPQAPRAPERHRLNVVVDGSRPRATGPLERRGFALGLPKRNQPRRRPPVSARPLSRADEEGDARRV